MKLYTFDPAPNPRRLTLYLKLKGIVLDTQQVDMAVAEQLTDAYRARYADSADAWYRYDNGYVYQVDPRTRTISGMFDVV